MKLLKQYKAYSLGLYAFLIFIHFVLKDRLFPISIIFYATPLILIILLGYLIALFYRKQKTIVYPIIIFQFVLSFYWFNNYYFTQTKKPLSQTNSVLFWNVAKRKQFPIHPIITHTKNNSCSIITLVEALHVNEQDLESLNTNLPNYSIKKLRGDMLLGVKGTIDSISYKYVDKQYKFNHIKTSINNVPTSVLIVDIYASPFINKKQPLIEVLDYANTHNIDIIVGDFNTPYESVHFTNYTKWYSSFHNYNNGFSATWPYSLPLLELDQIWVSQPLRPDILNSYKYAVSDHKLLIAEYYNINKR
ncbi:hypothetical protein [Pontimicrobium sp. MEBiC01747]